jgi:hypothetical protein
MEFFFAVGLSYIFSENISFIHLNASSSDTTARAYTVTPAFAFEDAHSQQEYIIHSSMVGRWLPNYLLQVQECDHHLRIVEQVGSNYIM